MSSLERVFGDFTPGEIAGATRALRWAAEELANTNNFTKEQTEALVKLVESNEELQRFFTTAESDGFAALRDRRFEEFQRAIISGVQDPIREIVKEENSKIWTRIIAIITGIVTLISIILGWIQNSSINNLIENLP